jgi:UDP:flavonoid glycosyltransferase YjiC (YdhE family)
VRVAVVTAGSRGDLEMFVPLVRRLERAGHAARLLLNAELAGAARAQGLACDVFTRPWTQADVAATRAGGELRDPRQLWRRPLALHALFRELEDFFVSVLHDTARACAAADVVLAAPIGFGALDAGEVGGAPVVQVAAYPLSRTRAFGSFLAPPWLRLRGLPAYLSHVLVERVAWRLLARAIQRFRRGLGLAALTRRAWLERLEARRVPLLYAWSQELLPRPVDWPERARVCGYFFPDDAGGASLAPDVARFLADGPPPIHVSFATISAPDRTRFARALVEALARTERRALVLRPWPQDVETTARVRLIGWTPYGLVLPRVSAAIHHGGQGSVGAALRAGIPSAALPGVVDHHFWGAQLHRRGLGPAPLPAERADAESLRRLIEALHAPALQARAREVGARVRAEDGVGRALAALEAQFDAARAAA